MPFDKSAVQARFRRWLDPVAGGIARLGISPNALTVIGLLLSILAGIRIAQGDTILATLLLLLGALCDILDGSMARRSGKASQRGAFLDSTLDRLAEISVFLGLLVLYRDHLFMQIVTALAMTGSLMTSYARARAEGLGVDCKVGLLERPERLVLLLVGLLTAPLRIAGYGLLELILMILAVLTYVTTFQRIVHVLRLAAGRTHPEARPEAAVVTVTEIVEESAASPEDDSYPGSSPQP